MKRLQRKTSRGLTLIESMILVVIVGIISLGFGISLQSSAHIPPAVDQRLDIHTRLVEKMEDLMSLDFATLSANSGLSDSITVGGNTFARTVAVTNFDADGDGIGNSDIVEVTVTVDSQSLKTRVTQP